MNIIAAPCSSTQFDAVAVGLHGGIPAAIIDDDARFDSESDSESGGEYDTFTSVPSTRSSSGMYASMPANIQRPNVPFAVVMPIKQTLFLHESLPSKEVLDKYTRTRFRVTDSNGRRRYRVVSPYPAAIPNAHYEAKVRDARANDLWTVIAGKSERTKYLHKTGSPFHIALHRKNWLKLLQKAAHGFVARHSQPSVHFLTITADSLSKRFSIYSVANNTHSVVATAKRSTSFVRDRDGVLFECAQWSLTVEPQVDTALMSALIAVLEQWTLEVDGSKNNSQHVNNSSLPIADDKALPLYGNANSGDMRFSEDFE